MKRYAVDLVYPSGIIDFRNLNNLTLQEQSEVFDEIVEALKKPINWRVFVNPYYSSLADRLSYYLLATDRLQEFYDLGFPRRDFTKPFQTYSKKFLDRYFTADIEEAKKTQKFLTQDAFMSLITFPEALDDLIYLLDNSSVVFTSFPRFFDNCLLLFQSSRKAKNIEPLKKIFLILDKNLQLLKTPEYRIKDVFQFDSGISFYESFYKTLRLFSEKELSDASFIDFLDSLEFIKASKKYPDSYVLRIYLQDKDLLKDQMKTRNREERRRLSALIFHDMLSREKLDESIFRLLSLEYLNNLDLNKYQTSTVLSLFESDFFRNSFKNIFENLNDSFLERLLYSLDLRALDLLLTTDKGKKALESYSFLDDYSSNENNPILRKRIQILKQSSYNIVHSKLEAVEILRRIEIDSIPALVLKEIKKILGLRAFSQTVSQLSPTKVHKIVKTSKKRIF